MLRIRQAVVADISLLLQMIIEFATFEKLLEHVAVTEESLRRDGFGPHLRFHAMILEWDGERPLMLFPTTKDRRPKTESCPAVKIWRRAT